ncbi:BatA domain-containing protein [Luteolibacter flavescens]|uniref:BatA domain-containing protein n=1 Tax=Luteolibacter flavescens TaxID=1859460 RepID=A0ABT3FJD1_9BACT|nr:BatA domain-containing protein [Luteolibacter flavescens]MCW1883309.1 BatA domain-containing protein [Luteolibacter flavescens]
MLTLSNPAGLWALLGIPAVLAIHFLQRQAVIIPISTLFLLEKTQRESASGRRFDRLMNSVPLWMQLLGVLLLTWLLAEPRYQKARSTQRVAIVLDSSASMAVTRDKLKEKLVASLPDLQGPATALELTVLESTPGKPKLYSGDNPEDFAKALDAWQPRSGLTDPSQALRLARSLVAREGIVVYVTDTPVEQPPFDARLLSLGEPIDNVGFTGVGIAEKEGAKVFQALVRNYSASRATRTWQVELPDGTRTEPRSIDLEPNAIVTLQAAFPAQAERMKLLLSPDTFTLDDVLPIVVPQPKKLAIFAATGGAYEDLSKKLLRSLEATESVNDTATADLTILSYDPLDPVLPGGHAIVFVKDETQGGAYLKGGIVAEKHPLIDALNWQSLLVRETIQLQRRESDDVLLWQGERPLIFLRETDATADTPASRQLCFNFDLRLSNASTQPAFIVMLHRFAEELREAKIAPTTELLESGQPLTLAANTGAEVAGLTVETRNLEGKEVKTDTLPASAQVRLEAPLEAGFLSVHQGETALLTASVHFADTREADFSECKPADTIDQGSAVAVERHTDEDHWWRAWFLLLLAALLVSWHFTREREAARKRAEPQPA